MYFWRGGKERVICEVGFVWDVKAELSGEFVQMRCDRKESDVDEGEYLRY